MRLSEDQGKALLAKLHSFRTDVAHCPYCGHNEWQLADRVFELRDFSKGGLTVGTPVYPVVAMLCAHCGYTHLFNAISLGVVERAKEVQTNASE